MRAHGYVVVLVKARTEKELTKVQEKLGSDGLPEPFGHTYAWYGGRMDLVAVVDSDEASVVGSGALANEHATRMPLGDNRFVGIYEASELLG